MDELTQRRMRHNEELFREINERIDEVRAPALRDTPTVYVCECADATCTQRVALEPDEYGEARANEQRFFVVRGHERPELETVVGGGVAYVLVEKHAG